MVQTLNSLYLKLMKPMHAVDGFMIESVYRNPARNEAVGGESKSRHMYGDAADLNAIDYDKNGIVDSKDLNTLDDAIKSEQGIDYHYPKTYTVHFEFKFGLGW